MILKYDVFRTFDNCQPVTDNRIQVQYICNSSWATGRKIRWSWQERSWNQRLVWPGTKKWTKNWKPITI